jgi:hypothetical protein
VAKAAPQAAAVASRQRSVQGVYDSASTPGLQKSVQNMYASGQKSGPAPAPAKNDYTPDPNGWEAKFSRIRAQAAGLNPDQLNGFVQRYTAVANSNPNNTQIRQVLGHLNTLKRVSAGSTGRNGTTSIPPPRPTQSQPPVNTQINKAIDGITPTMGSEPNKQIA